MQVLSYPASYSFFYTTLYFFLNFSPLLKESKTFHNNGKDMLRLIYFFFFKACSAGYFGENCNSSCGHCLNEAACHHINGTCDEECNPGYQAPYCTDGKIYSYMLAKHIQKL